LPGLLERLKFRNALSNLFLLGGELLLLGRELLKLLLRSCKLLLLGGKLGADALCQCVKLLAQVRRHGGRSCDGGRRGCYGDVAGPEVNLPGERASGADQGCHGKSRQSQNSVADFRSVFDDLNIFETGRPRKHADGRLCRLRPARIDGAWWQFSLTERTAEEPSALSLLKISRGGRSCGSS